MNKKHTFITFGVVLLSVIGSPLSVSAESITIAVEGNGEASQNSAEVQSESNTTVEQNNTTEINNDVNIDADTGNNTADNNTGGETNITTGDVSTNTNINNHNVNQNYVQTPTAGSGIGGSLTIAGNGANSQNGGSASSVYSTNINQNNTANITNSVQVSANTGNNSANGNLGNVTIKTGNITADTRINNIDVNASVAKILGNCNGQCIITHDLILKIFGNGAGSVNNIVFSTDETITYNSDNLADILNDVTHDLNTGGNSANNNNGDVSIITGDVFTSVDVTNSVNTNIFEKDCGCVPTPPPPPPPKEPNNPNNPGSSGGNGGNGGSGGSSNGDVLGTAIGEILPATGSFFMLWATVASLIAFFAGWYLRFRSGCAPGESR